MKKRKGFTGTPGKPSMKIRGWDGTAEGKQYIEELRKPADGTWSIVSAAAACDRSLGQVSAFTVLALLGKYRNTQTGECFPSVVLLSRMLGITRRSVQRHLDRLVERGYLVVLPRRVKVNLAGSRQTSNAYVMLFPPMPAAPEGDEGTGSDETPTLDPPAPDGLPMASAASATDGVAVDGVSPDVGLTQAESPLRQMVTTPATDDGKPCDTICRSNAPTKNDPILDVPSAEAGRSRARKAPADEDAAHRGNGISRTDPEASKAYEARQVMKAVARNARMYQPPKKQPLDQLADALVGKSKRHAGHVQAAMLHWLIDLEAAGLTAEEAVAAVLEDGRMIVSYYDGDSPADLVEMVADLVKVRVADLDRVAA